MSKNQLVEEKVHFTSLEGNLIGDSADRSILIYLPPGYESSRLKQYPVLYLLHGGLTNNLIWIGKSFNNYYGDFNIKTVMDKLIADGKVREMIVVMPDTHTVFQTSWYVNAPVLGNYEDYIVHELTRHIDANYRTLAQRESRGIGGHSTGGFGAVYLGMNHPETYAALYGHESSALTFEDFFLWKEGHPKSMEIVMRGDWEAIQTAESFIQLQFSAPASFSPNPDRSPFYVDWLWVKDGEQLIRNEEIWQRWLTFEPTNLTKRLKDNLLQLRAIKFDGATESGNLVCAHAFHEALMEIGIPHEFEAFTGGHIDCTASRMESIILPFFSEVLEAR